MERVIGLGGPFLKAKDPKALAAWYEKHLGIQFKGQTYTVWPFKEQAGFNILSFFEERSQYYAPSKSSVMINFIVKDLMVLLDTLRSEGVEVVGEPVSEDYGKFGWVLDLEGNKIELWQAPE
jgi:D-3-phosphoglycerate dehydrogenase